MARNAWFRVALLALAAGAGRPLEAQSARTAETQTALAATSAGRPAARPGAADSLAQIEAALADSVQRSREIEVMRETFAYAGGTRDPFASLINKDKSGPEIGDLALVGVYLDLRAPTNNVVVLRERGSSAKRHKMRVGDQLGRARLTQIRARDAVFMVQDFGYERQETLSLRKQEVETP
ncbi:MAG: hypothetical protein M3Q93_03175 [Gemmatimonadota bacterium]|nr:hypothetical protein [Gemmatimonadota bacterium]